MMFLNVSITVCSYWICFYCFIEQSRRDDLESLGYVLMYFLRGRLELNDKCHCCSLLFACFSCSVGWLNSCCFFIVNPAFPGKAWKLVLKSRSMIRSAKRKCSLLSRYYECFLPMDIKFIVALSVFMKLICILIQVLCKSYPPEFVSYFHFCRSLRFEDRPDYAYLKRLFRDLFIREGRFRSCSWIFVLFLFLTFVQFFFI